MKNIFYIALFALLYGAGAYAETPLINCTGTNQALQSTASPPKYACATIAGGSGTPGGSNGQIQYNNSGAFGGLTNPAAISKISSGIFIDPRNYGAQCTGGYGVNPAAVTITTAGTGFAVNDKFEIADLTISGRMRGGALATGHVTSVNGGGGITGMTIDTVGSGYFTSVLWIQPLTGIGVGAALNITGINSFPSAPTTTLASGGNATGTGLGGSYNDGGAYAVGDIFAIPNPSLNGNYMTGRVTSVSAGRVTGYTINNPGGDYSVVSAVPTITLTGFGSGLTINVTSSTSASNTFDDTYGLIVAANAANTFGGAVLVPDNCWIGTLMPPAGTAYVGQGYGVNYAYGDVPNNITPSTPPHMFIIGTPTVGIDFNGQANIALANFEVRGYTGATFGGGTTWDSTACIGGKNGGGGGSKVWLYNMSAKSCFTGFGSNDGTGGFIFAVSKNSDYSSNQNGIYGPFSDFLTEGDTLASDSSHGIWMSSSAGGLLRIEHPRIEYVTTGIELDSGGLQADITSAQFDRAAQCSLYVNGASLVNITGGNMKGGGLEGTLTITGAVSGTAGVVRLAVTGYGNNANGGATPTSGLVTGDKINVSGVVGTTEANGNQQTITVVDGTHIELQGTTFTHAYVSGGLGNVNGKGSYICLNNATDVHASNVGFYGSSAGTLLAAASVVDATGSSRISFDGGTANSGNGNQGGWQQAFGNFHNSSNIEPTGFHKNIVNNPYFDNGTVLSANDNGQIGINTNSPAASALFDIVSTTLGSRPMPSMTTTQKNAISSPAEGLWAYDTTLHAPYFWNGSAWTATGAGGGGSPGGSNLQVQYNNSGSFGGYTNQQLTALIFPPVVFSATTKTLALTDAWTLQESSNASAQTITIPLNATVAFAADTIIQVEQNGAGAVTIAPISGVTLNGGSANITIGAQYSAVYLRKDHTLADTWYLEGIPANIAFLNVAQAWTAGQAGAQSTPAISTSTFTPDLKLGQSFDFPLVHAACPCTIANPNNIAAQVGQMGVIEIDQSATGSDTVSWGSDYKFAGATAPTLSTGANAQDYFSYYVKDSTHVIISSGILNAH